MKINNKQYRTISSVVSQHLCTQCGTCVAVCANKAIEMQETPSGLFYPNIKADRCNTCGECIKICPGLSVNLNLSKNIDPFKGKICNAYVGYACDDKIRAAGQSGGVITALLLHLLHNEQIDAALVTSMPKDGSLRPKPMLAKNHKEIISASGSKYCPVAANTALSNISSDEKIAVIGPACQIHGLNNLSIKKHKLAKNILYKIGLFCDRSLLFTTIDQMVKDANRNIKEIKYLEYRSKARNGWPGEVCFHSYHGEKLFYQSSLRTKLKEYFTPPRCRICFDKLNILSDLSIGDSYNVSESNKGNSVIIARTDNGELILKDACKNGFLRLKRIDPELIFKGQGIAQRRKNFSAFSIAWSEMGRTLPEYEGLSADYMQPADSESKSFARKSLLINCNVAESKTKKATFSTVKKYQLIFKLNNTWLVKNLRRLFKLRILFTAKE